MSTDLDEAVEAARKVLEKLPEDQSNIIEEMMNCYEERLENLKEELDDGDTKTLADGSEDAINKFLDCIDRPVGTRDFTIPKTGESTRALIGLYDAINRKL